VAAVARFGRPGVAAADSDGRGKPVSPQTLRALTAHVRRYRRQAAHRIVPDGEVWRAIMPEIAGLAVGERISFLRDLSRANLRDLRSETDDLMDKEEFRRLYHGLMSLRLSLWHSTSAIHVIAQTGRLSSERDLQRRGEKLFSSGLTYVEDARLLQNNDFVFYKFVIGDVPPNTSHGATNIVLDFAELERQGGWISLRDQMYPLVFPELRAVRHGGRTVRTTVFAQDDNAYGLSRWIHTYPDAPEEMRTRVSGTQQEVFYGSDAREGIARSVLREVGRIGGEFQREALAMTDPESFRELVLSLFRPEAKLPSGPIEMNPPGGGAQGRVRPIKIVNPDGDGRFNRDGTVNPAVMASYYDDSQLWMIEEDPAPHG
jgi:hypothetical protein